MNGSAGPELEALFRAVYAAPGDVAAKLVLADALQERGDPLGEFIALQVQPSRSKKVQLRLEKLKRKHLAAFLGPLANVVKADDQVWEQGFLIECRAALDGSTVAAHQWGSVRKLTLAGDASLMPHELTSRAMSSLVELQSANLQALFVLANAERPLPLQVLGIDGPGLPDQWPDYAQALVREAKQLPKLARLGLRFWHFEPAMLEWLWDAPVMTRLKVLELAMGRAPRDLKPVLDSVRRRKAAPEVLVIKDRLFEVKIKREADWSVMAFTIRTPMVEPAVGFIGGMLASLEDSELTRLDVTSDFTAAAADLAGLKKQSKRFTSLRWVSWPP